ncbi:hypothetical protein [Peribacillus simplex]|uniref:hypothetical protein n=1 Tax=Peribacillus simplex TaxID=1478 RepID=UPI003D2A404F
MSQESAEWKSDGFSEVNDEEGFWQGVKDCIPTLFGYLSIGFAAGVVEKPSGLRMMEWYLCRFYPMRFRTFHSCKSPSIGHDFYFNSRHLLLSAAHWLHISSKV